jgi:hypothetical protein
MCNTYGTWLRGDPRGWRERHHREHVEGDYRNPPESGTFENILRRSKRLMKREPVRLDSKLCEIALLGLVECLMGDEIIVLTACLDATHLHVLAQFKDQKPRLRLGWAKLAATKRVKEHLNAHGDAVGAELVLKTGEGIWGKRSECVPIRDRGHRLNTLNYILDHRGKGAAVWMNPRIRRGNVGM